MFFAEKAVEFFAQLPNAILELKTKSTEIDLLLNLDHKGHTVLAWTLNPQEIITGNELKTAPLTSRLKAAARAVEAGYKLAFHLDPILSHPEWQTLYGSLIDELYSRVPADMIAWISMGTLRYPPSMKEKLIAYYPNNTLPYAEMIRGTDRKMRYARPIRLPMYRFIYDKLTRHSHPPFVYFCMENRAIWESVTGAAPENNAQLDYMFAESLFHRFPGLIPKKPKFKYYEKGFPLEHVP